MIEKEKQLRAKVDKLTADVVFYKGRVSDYHNKVSELEKKAEDLEYVKRHIGADEVDRIVDKVKKIQEVKKKNMKHQLIL